MKPTRTTIQDRKYQHSAQGLLAHLGFSRFLLDKAYFIVLALLIWIIVLMFLIAFKVSTEVIIMLSVLGGLFVIITLAIEYLRRRQFYKNFLQNLNELDQAYLILETLERPNFYDGKIFFDALYKIDKSMNENVKLYRTRAHDFQEYVEMWIHEVKTPLATLTLLSKDSKINEQIKRLDDYVEQILYFARAENAERDYLISEVSLVKVVGAVANRNREMLQARKIDFVVEKLDYNVRTDGKWLEFIINQIISNSIKYQSHVISISVQSHDDVIDLLIRDDGIGISEKDLPRVFDKSFTGSNGHKIKQSTGMGLYIAKVLCEKLGHKISIESMEGEYTEVKITFSKHHYYDVLYN